MSGGSFTGDTSALDEMIEAFNPEALKTAIVERVVVKVAEVAAAQYAAGQGPDGVAWPPRADGSPSRLGALAAGIVFQETDGGITASGDEKLAYHAATRPVFPGAGLSAPWAEAADEGATEALKERLGGS